jgi:hypothetical protein
MTPPAQPDPTAAPDSSGRTTATSRDSTVGDASAPTPSDHKKKKKPAKPADATQSQGPQK